jgi:hypothetical protein
MQAEILFFKSGLGISSMPISIENSVNGCPFVLTTAWYFQPSLGLSVTATFACNPRLVISIAM